MIIRFSNKSSADEFTRYLSDSKERFVQTESVVILIGDVGVHPSKIVEMGGKILDSNLTSVVEVILVPETRVDQILDEYWDVEYQVKENDEDLPYYAEHGFDVSKFGRGKDPYEVYKVYQKHRDAFVCDCDSYKRFQKECKHCQIVRDYLKHGGSHDRMKDITREIDAFMKDEQDE